MAMTTGSRMASRQLWLWGNSELDLFNIC